VGSYGGLEFRFQRPTSGFTIANPYVVGKSPASDVPSNSPDDSMMCPTNLAIVCVAGAATMAIIAIPIVGNSFTVIPSYSLCIVISGLASTACVRLLTRQYMYSLNTVSVGGNNSTPRDESRSQSSFGVVSVSRTALVANLYCLQLDFACPATLATPSFRLLFQTIDLGVLIPEPRIWD